MGDPRLFLLRLHRHVLPHGHFGFIHPLEKPFGRLQVQERRRRRLPKDGGGRGLSLLSLSLAYHSALLRLHHRRRTGQ